MIKHIVTWNIKEENKEENMKEMKRRLEDLKGKIEEIVDIEVGININKSEAKKDIVLLSEFKSLKDLDIYQNHPLHLEVGKFVKEIAIDRNVVDYEV
ncbi:MAG: Dabb family protein [Clostridium chrysemydis]|uniref:Dabb family protein n=1 Tax=Clostridium TaxID=1485 RepID=UPI002153300B|nr:Dabb family protein [Clostridium sp. LY3-2]MCR6513528.1 Dabb family protein [Clostridium sp. LY3-2]